MSCWRDSESFFSSIHKKYCLLTQDFGRSCNCHEVVVSQGLQMALSDERCPSTMCLQSCFRTISAEVYTIGFQWSVSCYSRTKRRADQSDFLLCTQCSSQEHLQPSDKKLICEATSISHPVKVLHTLITCPIEIRRQFHQASI